MQLIVAILKDNLEATVILQRGIGRAQRTASETRQLLSLAVAKAKIKGAW